jgi:hypothetical protein
MKKRQKVELSLELFPANFYQTTRCHTPENCSLVGITCRKMTEWELQAASPAQKNNTRLPDALQNGVPYSLHFDVQSRHVDLPVYRSYLLHDQRIEDGDVEFL